ncbi:MAG: quinone-dependent dihydroorotate dehydrogenase [Anaerolineae bacterium]|nr:quinone-dependent dihydroorotate dehydrogenase [Anaerolineae bacterium]
MNIYAALFRRFGSLVDPELSHSLAMFAMTTAAKSDLARSFLKETFAPPADNLAVEVLGMRFEHPLGLAAGFDKDAICPDSFNLLGFSFVEVGTVTPTPQPGNAGRRLFRLLPDDALINRLGFPSTGMDAVRRNLDGLSHAYPIGISLGKNKDTPQQDAYRDYLAGLERLYPVGDYFVVNISSPNTPGLRALQNRDALDILLTHLQGLNTRLSATDKPKPLLVKIAPDISWPELDQILDVCLKHETSGIVATNASTAREGLSSPLQNREGGLSGAPLRSRSTEIIRYIYQQTEAKLPIIGVGGVFSGDHVWEKLLAGASLVQAYTGLVYQGPLFVRDCCARLGTLLAQSDARHLQEIIGAGKVS